MNVKCFFLEPTDQRRYSLRRYAGDLKCTGKLSYHNVMALIGNLSKDEIEQPPKEDPRWPKACECGYVFQDSDNWQLFSEHVYRRQDTGELTTIGDSGPGAMWFADWMLRDLDRTKVGNLWRGPDDHCLIVKCPPNGHEWTVDGRCSNCTKPTDDLHKCWIRHGTPPNITVDKNGNTCSAGAGSILVPGWHGYLRNGELVTA